jgi:RHS repeat-associated protein
MKRLSFHLVLVLCSFFTGYAGLEPVNMRISGTALTNGAAVFAIDNKWPVVGSTGSHTVQSAYAKVVLGVDERILALTPSHSTGADVNIIWKDAAGVATTINNVTLTVSYDPAKSLNTFTYKNSYTIKGAHHIFVIVNKLFDLNNANATPLTTIPANLFMEAEQVSERYYAFDSKYIQNNTAYTVGKTFMVSSKELEIFWQQIPGAEEYDLEWTFVNDYTGALNSFAVNNIDFAFRNNVTRVRTPNLKYRISLNYEHGYVLFRVRGVARYLTPISGGYKISELAGEWSATDPLGPTAMTRPLNTLVSNPVFFGANLSFFYYNNVPFDENKNLSYSAAFAEEGKKKEVVSYYDGSLRERQIVTRNNSENQVIVGQTFYDYQGRPAVTAIPVPVYNSSNLPEKRLMYQEDFNLSDQLNHPVTGNPAEFSKADFDVDVTGGACPPTANGMKTTGGASKYYSSNNPDKEGSQAYVPDAEKYPFKHTVYMPDNTGRIRKQSGVGDDFKMGSGHETSNFYNTPFQRDLDELFGSEAGNCERYQKNTIVDPNGQITISYMNKDGKVVATSLAGGKPANLNSANNSGQVVKTVKFLGPNESNYDNINKFDGTSLIFSWPIVPNTEDIYSFEYNLTVPQFKDACMPGSMCYDCDYTLELSVKDECGNSVYSSASSPIPINGSIDFTCHGDILYTLSSSPPSPFKAHLYAGKQYYLEKKLTINKANMDKYLADYLTNNSCIKNKSYFISQALANIVPGDCNIDCSSCSTKVAAFMLNHNNPNSGDANYLYISPTEAQALYDKCAEACKPVNKCETEFKLMLGDVSPGGQYGKYNANGNIYDASQYPLSIYNWVNQLPQSLYNLAAPPVLYGQWIIQNIFSQVFPSLMLQYSNCYSNIPVNEWAGWTHPYFYSVKQKGFLTTADKYHYFDDADGTKLSIISLTEISPGVYSPAPQQLSYVKTGLNNLKYVYPEELLNLKDFIDNFKPTWAYSLVKNHPEWCYFKWCEEHSTPSTIAPYMSSDDFDNYLRTIDTWQAAVGAAGTTGLNFSLGTGAGNNDVGDLIGKDPYFATGGQGMAAVAGYAAGYLKSLMQYRLVNFMKGPGSSGTIINAKDAANYITRYATMYYEAVPSPFTFANPVAFPTNVTFNQGQMTEVQNREWKTYRDFYLSSKAEIQTIGAHINAINKNTNDHCGCYNGCIGNPTFDAFNLPGNGEYDGFAVLMPYTYFGTGTSGLFPVGGYFQNSQPCNASKKTYYSSKQKRFINSSDMLSALGASGTDPLSIGNNMVANAEYENYQQTGQCPMATKLQYFLNDMLKANMFKGTISYADLYFYPSFTQEMYTQVSNLTVPPFKDYFFVDHSIPGPSMHFDFAQGGANGPYTCGITLTGSGSTLWAKIISFNGIKYTGTTSFQITAFIDHDGNPATPAIPELLTGSSCFQSICSFSSMQCKPNKTGKDLLNLINFVFNNIKTHPSNLSSLYGPQYDLNSTWAPELALLTPQLSSAFGLNTLPLFLTNLVSNPSPNHVSFTLDNTVQHYNFLFNDPGNQIPGAMHNISYFSNLVPDPGDPCTFYLTANIVNVTNVTPVTGAVQIPVATTQTYQVMVTMSGAQCISIGGCADKIPQHCNTSGYLTMLDLGNFLNELRQKNQNGTAPMNISGFNYFTDNIKAVITSQNTGYINYFDPNYVKFTLGYGTVPYQGDCDVVLNMAPGMNWASIVSFGKMTADLTQPGSFSVVVTYNVNQTATITGTSCFNLENCNECSLTGNVVFTDDFDRFNNTFQPIPGVSFAPSNYVPGVSWKVTEQYYAACSPVTAPSFGGFLPPPNTSVPDVYHLTVTNKKFDGACTPNPPLPQFFCNQRTPSNLSTALPPDNQSPNQDMLCLFVDYTNMGSSAQVLPATVYNMMIPASPGKKYRISFWYNIDIRCPLIAKIKANGVTINSTPITWSGGPMAWVKMQGICIQNTSNVLQFQIDIENPLSVGGQGAIMFDDITVEELDCHYSVRPPVVSEPPKDECLDQLTDIATHNGEINYQYYVDSVSAVFKNGYINKCKKTTESLYGTFKDQVSHYTLYYYDQAGNLIKTVPPEGVSLLPVDTLTTPGANTVQAIRSDRVNGTQSVFTEHTLASRYQYNSLNQLVKQKLPDHTGITIFNSTSLPANSGIPTGYTSYEMDFYPNGNNGLMVGKNSLNKGEIYATSDGGNTWTKSNMAGSGDIVKVQHMGNNVVFAITSTGNLLRSNNNGTTWDSYSITNGTRLNAMAFYESFNAGTYYGMVGGDNSKVYWCNMTNPASPQIVPVAAPNALSFDVKTIRFVSIGGWPGGYRFFIVGGTNGVLLHSYNPAVMGDPFYYLNPPALNVAASPINSNVKINDMTLEIDASLNLTGYVVGKDALSSNGFAGYLSTNLGNNVNSLANVIFSSIPKEITTITRRPAGTTGPMDDNINFGGANGEVYYLTIGSAPNNFITANPLTGISNGITINHLAHADVLANTSVTDVYAFCSDGKIYKTANYSSNYSSIYTISNLSLNGAAIPQTYAVSNPIFIAANAANIFRATPTSNFSPVTNCADVVYQQFNGVSVSKDNNGSAFVAGNNGTLLKANTSSSGWSQLSTGVTDNLNSVYALSATNVLAVGDNGKLLKYNGTSVSLHSSSPLTSTKLNRIWFKDATNGYVVGDAGKFTSTSNSGGSFGSVQALTTNNFYDVHFFGQVGLAVGSGGAIWRTTDNGVNWQSKTFNTAHIYRRVHLVDNNTAFAFGDNGVVIKSTDGGVTWQTLTANAGSCNFNAVTFNANAGQILSTGNCNGYIMSNTQGDYSTRFYYDKLGRLIISQNAKQYNKTPKAYSYTIYDALGRVAQVGEVTTNTDPVTLLGYNNVIDPGSFTAWLMGGTKSEVTSTLYDNSAGNSAFTQENLRKRVSATYLDSDDNLTNGYTYASYYSYDVHGNVKTVMQEDKDLVAAVGTAAGLKYIGYKYDLISGKVNEVIYQSGSPDEFRHKYEYDADNRLTNVLTSSDGGVNWQQDVKYYYYKHGPLARTELGPNKTQGIDYAYTLQGWIKGVNGAILSGNTDIGKDAITGNSYLSTQTDLHKFIGNDGYAYNLNYFTTTTNQDYQAIDQTKYSYSGGTSFDANPTAVAFMTTSNYNALYNGNISAMQTSIVKVNSGSSNQSLYTARPQLTTYKYDQLNRINEMNSYSDFTGNSVLTSNSFAGATTVTNAYRNTFTYDANGNIQTQKRYSDGASGAVLLDDLTYNYDVVSGKKRSNKLYHVDDVGTTAVGDINDQNPNNYAYDEIGNLVEDVSEEIDNITWNVYGKIKTIERFSTSTKPDLEFVYDASGNRAQKIIKNKSAPGVFVSSANFIYLHYLMDPQGNTMATYERTSGSYKLKDRSIYGASRLGLLDVNMQYSGLPLTYNSSASLGTAFNNKIIAGTRMYELSNHLGNVLTTLSDRKLPVDANADNIIDKFVPDALSTNDYYAFGQSMPGRQYNNGNYRYGFNGQEQDNEVAGTGNVMTAEFWEYDTRLGKRWNIDPMSAEKPWMSPYHAFSNNPILNVDPNGAWDSDFKDKDGKTVQHVDDGSNAVFQQTGKGVDVHYEFTGYSNQGGKDIIDEKTVTSVIQEQQKLNISNPDLQPGAGGASSHCNQATHCIQKAVGSAIGKEILTPGRANDIAESIQTNTMYKNVTLTDATKTANAGGLVIVAYKNPVPTKSGHLATLSVGENIKKGSLANVGYSKGVTNFVNPTGTAENKWKDAAFKKEDWNNNVKFYILTIPLKK